MDIINTLAKVKLFYLLLGILLVYMSKCLIGLIVYFIAKKDKKNVSLKTMLHIELIYPFFAGITPGSLGGESFEVFYFKNGADLSFGKASNVVMQKYILYLISLILVNFITVILNLFTNIVSFNGLVSSAVIINFAYNIALLGFLFLLVYNKKVNHFVMNKGMSFLHKIRIIKDVKKTQKKLNNYLDNFDEGVDKLRSDKKLFIRLIGMSMLSLICLLGAALPIASSLGINNISLLNLFILVTFTRMISLLIVTPGNSGGAEYCFIYLFTGLLASDDIMAYMLIWRFVTYYVPLISGGILAMLWGKGDKNEKISCSES